MLPLWATSTGPADLPGPLPLTVLIVLLKSCVAAPGCTALSWSDCEARNRKPSYQKRNIEWLIMNDNNVPKATRVNLDVLGEDTDSVLHGINGQYESTFFKCKRCVWFSRWMALSRCRIGGLVGGLELLLSKLLRRSWEGDACTVILC